MDQPSNAPSHTEPLIIAQYLAMSGDLTDSMRQDVIDMLHELAERRRADGG